MRRRSARPRAEWGSTGSCASAPTCSRASATGSTTRCGIPRPTLISPRCFDRMHYARRVPNKAALQARFGLDAEPAAFLCGVVSRLTLQKGMDLLLEALPSLVDRGAQLALLGSGDKALEDGFVAAAARFPGRVAALTGYDESVAHLVQAGADVLLVPSRFEPCGLTQLCALRYGTIPIVARVGGLADTVVDANEMALAAGAGTGIQFAPVTRQNLEFAIGRAIALRRDPARWRRMQSRAMATDVGWTRPAQRVRRALSRARGARHGVTMRDVGPGSPEPLGVTPGPDGANVAVFSAHATAIELCLFDASGAARDRAGRIAGTHRRRVSRLRRWRRGGRSLRRAGARPVRPARGSPLQCREAARRSVRAGARPGLCLRSGIDRRRRRPRHAGRHR